jgi:pimeloyl-ACP methyl ester carboxylesterase
VLAFEQFVQVARGDIRDRRDLVGCQTRVTEMDGRRSSCSDRPICAADAGSPPEQRPFSLAAFTQPSGDPAWKTIPSWYLVATKDHAIPPKTELFMAHRAGSKVFYARGASHVPMISQPRKTLSVIEKAVHAVD